jgi:ABC-2 type transport system permease protein
VSVSEVFEAQTFSNFFRFPMIFLCGLFFPIESLPLILRPLSYILPLTYGVDILRGAVSGTNMMYIGLDFTIIIFFCAILFYVSIKNINRKWIT